MAKQLAIPMLWRKKKSTRKNSFGIALYYLIKGESIGGSWAVGGKRKEKGTGGEGEYTSGGKQKQDQ